MIDLSVNLCGKRLQNPLVLASGILGTDADILKRVADFKIGAVTSKSCGLLPRKGHENPTVVAWEHGLINGVGLTNPGVEKEVEELLKLRKLLKNSSCKIIASFFAGSIDEFPKVAQKLAKAKPDFFEVNISCPNTMDDCGTPFACKTDNTYKITKIVKEVARQFKIPLIIKLSPNVTNIVNIGKAASEAGADAITAINTVLGMIIDLESARPIMTNKIAGLSGPAIKPISLRCVYQLAEQLKIPIIGLGGVTSGSDAIEMIMAGATAVGIGSATYYRGIEAFDLITQEMQAWLEKHNIKSLDEIRGKAHAN